MKLLFYGVKPVFVFDGDAPTLKKRTIVSRALVLVGGAGGNADQLRALYRNNGSGGSKELAATSPRRLKSCSLHNSEVRQQNERLPGGLVFAHFSVRAETDAKYTPQAQGEDSGGRGRRRKVRRRRRGRSEPARFRQEARLPRRPQQARLAYQASSRCAPRRLRPAADRRTARIARKAVRPEDRDRGRAARFPGRSPTRRPRPELEVLWRLAYRSQVRDHRRLAHQDSAGQPPPRAADARHGGDRLFESADRALDGAQLVHSKAPVHHGRARQVRHRDPDSSRRSAESRVRPHEAGREQRRRLGPRCQESRDFQYAADRYRIDHRRERRRADRYGRVRGGRIRLTRVRLPVRDTHSCSFECRADAFHAPGNQRSDSLRPTSKRGALWRRKRSSLA